MIRARPSLFGFSLERERERDKERASESEREKERKRERAGGKERKRETREKSGGGDLIKTTTVKPNAAATRPCTTHLFFGGWVGVFFGGGWVGEYVCAGGRLTPPLPCALLHRLNAGNDGM